jgi:threonine dehydrogenase-like Zn-dependent dehydrogenase
MVDMGDNRPQVSSRLGETDIINNQDGKAAEKIMQITDGRGVDTAIEAVGQNGNRKIVLCGRGVQSADRSALVA